MEVTRHRRWTRSDDLMTNAADARALFVLTLRGPSIRSFGGTVSTLNETTSGLPWLPARSIALTAKAWVPFLRGPMPCGEEQPPYACESRRHRKREPGSLAEKLKEGLASWEAEPSAGPEVIVAFGAFVSTVNAREAIGLCSPPLTALT